MARRLYSPREPAAFTLDGEKLVGERGEPIAAALVGAGKWTVARSPKFHRPRGPSCMRGACDGCLARVDGVANVMTCLTPLEAGAAVTSQNTLGSREVDLLRMTDWFFPDGMNHHELFAGVPGVQDAMQLFARRVAGLGLLPDAGTAKPPAPAKRRAVDVLVVGAGPAGMAVAVAIAARGEHGERGERGQRGEPGELGDSARKGRGPVEVVDDGLMPGGGARGLHPTDDLRLASTRTMFDQAVAAGAVRLRTRTVAAAVFGRDVLVVGADSAGPAVEILEPRALIIAAGAHDGVVPFENNELPGVMSARAACLLASTGVSVGDRVVLLTENPGSGVSFGEAFERAVARGAGQERQERERARVTRVTSVVKAKGGSHVKAVVVLDGGTERTVTADALLVDAPRAPAYELCEQAGATLAHGPAGFAPVTTKGRIADGVWAIGEVTGAPLVGASFVEAAEEIAAQVR